MSFQLNSLLYTIRDIFLGSIVQLDTSERTFGLYI